MRGVLGVAMLGLGACTFDGLPATDGPAPPIDAGVPDATGLCGGTVWSAEFATDPTQQDLNGDGLMDWALRNDSAFPVGELTGTTWSTPAASQPLDTRPRQSFTTRTIVDVRMRNTSTCCARGAVFWINVGYDGSGFAAVYVDVKLTGPTAQTVKFVRKTATGQDDEFDSASGQSIDFVDIHLDIDPVASTVQYAGGGADGLATLERQTTANTDSWATVVAMSSASEFDQVRVEVCPPAD